MGVKYLWDTNIAIYYLQKQFPPSAEKFIDKTLEDSGLAISVVTEIELLCWKTPTDKDLEVLRHFIADALVLELQQDIKFKTAEIRKAYVSIRATTYFPIENYSYGVATYPGRRFLL